MKTVINGAIIYNMVNDIAGMLRYAKAGATQHFLSVESHDVSAIESELCIKAMTTLQTKSVEEILPLESDKTIAEIKAYLAGQLESEPVSFVKFKKVLVSSFQRSLVDKVSTGGYSNSNVATVRTGNKDGKEATLQSRLTTRSSAVSIESDFDEFGDGGLGLQSGLGIPGVMTETERFEEAMRGLHYIPRFLSGDKASRTRADFEAEMNQLMANHKEELFGLWRSEHGNKRAVFDALWDAGHFADKVQETEQIQMQTLSKEKEVRAKHVAFELATFYERMTGKSREDFLDMFEKGRFDSFLSSIDKWNRSVEPTEQDMAEANVRFSVHLKARELF